MSRREPIETEQRIVDGLAKIAQVLKKGAWQGAGSRGLTPTQGEILRFVASSARPPRLSDVAKALGVKAPTASKAVAALLEKGLLEKVAAPEDARAVALTLTRRGKGEAEHSSEWPSALASAVGSLGADEQRVLLRTIVKLIRKLQIEGQIEVARTCASCVYFRPYAHDDAERPHHCAFVDAPFGDGALRVDCPDHVEASPSEARRIRARFLDVID